MGLLDWLKGFFKRKKEVTDNELFFQSGIDYFFKKIAVDTCIDLIASAISQCEIQTFEKGVKNRSNNYYLFNVEPNQNQNATNFLHELVRRLVYDNECLVVMINKQLYIASNFNREEQALKENKYTEVMIGDYKLSDTFDESEVMYFELRNEKITNVIDGMYESLGRLLISSMNYYKRKNNKRLLIKGDFLRPQDDETQEAIDELFEGQLKNWFDPNVEGSAFQLQEGYDLDDMSDGQTGTNNAGLSRDIAALIDDIFNYVAMRFNVPRGLLKGDVSDLEGQIESFLMFSVNPISELIQDEINRTVYSKEEYLKRTYVKIDTTKIKVIDISKIATALDKVFAIGGMNINDVLEELGREPINEEWANHRYVTKNYQRVDKQEDDEDD